MLTRRAVHSFALGAATIVATVTLGTVRVRGADPATAPAMSDDAAAAPLPTDSPIRQWFADLASPDAAVREAATTALMGLDRPQLNQLRELVRRSAPLATAQAAALHDIVVHDYLAAEPYPHDTRQGFLGLLAMQSELIDQPLRLGVDVDDHRIPGFPSFRMLRSGDVILAVLVDPQAPPLEQINKPTPSFDALSSAISAAGAGQRVVLEVLRGGQRIHVTLELAARPEISQAAFDLFFNERRHRGEAYWEREFLPLLRAGMS